MKKLLIISIILALSTTVDESYDNGKTITSGIGIRIDTGSDYTGFMLDVAGRGIVFTLQHGLEFYGRDI